MIKRPVVISLAAAVLLLLPSAGTAQVSVGGDCSPGIGACGSLRFSLESLGPRAGVTTLFIEMITTGWTFRTGPNPSVGTYSAEDFFGPFGGFTQIGAGSFFIDFIENGFPMEVGALQTAFLDVEVNPGNAQPIWFRYSGTTDNDGTFEGTVTPEPLSMILLGSGLAGIAALRRRRKTGLG